VVQEAPVKPQPVVKPIPVPQPPTPRLVNNVPEPEQLPEPIQEMVQPAPAASSVAPLDAVATERYEQLLVAWLEKHKKYPRRAKRLRIEGDGMLRILIDRTGRTQQVTLEQRTGNRLLDKAALEMAQRADPFPPIPENDPRRELVFIVPVAFVLH
jgi:protein TonB